MSNTKSKNSQSFEVKLAELEKIVSWFESEEVTLDKSMQQFEKGMKLATDLEEELQIAENKIAVIKQKFDNISQEEA